MLILRNVPLTGNPRKIVTLDFGLEKGNRLLIPTCLISVLSPGSFQIEVDKATLNQNNKSYVCVICVYADINIHEQICLNLRHLLEGPILGAVYPGG